MDRQVLGKCAEKVAGRRILILCGEHVGGSTTAALGEAELWKELGARPQLWTSPLRSAPGGLSSPLRKLHSAALSPRLARALPKLLAEHRTDPFDLLHAHYAWPHGRYCLQLASYLEVHTGRRPQTALTIHGTDGLRPLRSQLHTHLLPRMMAEFDRVEVPSEAFGALLQALSKGVIRTQVAPNYIQEEGWSRAPEVPEQNPLRAAFIGNLNPIKDPFAAIQAFALACLQRPAELWIFGDGPLRRPLERFAAGMPLGKQVHFWGALDPKRTAELASKCHVQLATSRFESFGLAALEAVAAGRALVAPRGRGYEAWLDPHLLTEAGDLGASRSERAGALAADLSRLGSDREERVRCADAQRRAAWRSAGPATGQRLWRSRVAWLKTHRAGDSSTAGALKMMGTLPSAIGQR